MISEAPAKIISWLRSPKSLAAKAGIGVATIAVVAGGTVSAFAITGGFTPTDSDATKNSQVAANTENSSQEAPLSAQNQTEVSDSNTTPAQDTTSNTTQPTTGNQGATTSSEPQAPAPAVYTDTYPDQWKSAPLDSKLDDWSQWNRESTSYTAWKVKETFGTMYSLWGNANQWPAKADTYHVARGTDPKLHSVAISGNFSAWVEAINSDGTIDVSFYNWGNTGEFGYWNNVKPSQFSTYIYFGN